MKKLKIGITGGIGAGKSIVSQILKSMGFAVYDSDYNAKLLMNTSEDIRTALIAQFGTETYQNGKIDRCFLASKIFGNKENLQYINGTVHPAVFRHFTEWAEKQKSNPVFIESAILYESGLDKFVDSVIYVKAPETLRLTRAAERDNTSEKDIEKRIKNQVEEEIAAQNHAENIIINDGRQSVIKQLNAALQKLRSY